MQKLRLNSLKELYHLTLWPYLMRQDEEKSAIKTVDIADAAANPASFSVEGLSQSNRSISELIAADKYLRKRAAASRHFANPFAGMVSVGIPPGPCGR